MPITKILPLLLAASLLGAGCFGFKSETTVQGNVNGNGAAMLLEGKNAINVDAQKPGSSVTVSFAVLEKPGYVVIHAEANGGAGKILGQSALLAAGENRNVKVDVQIQNGVSYFAMLHLDNGNGTFSAAEDAPAKDSQENAIMMRFEGSTEASTPGDVMMDANVNTNAAADVGGMKVDVDANVTVKTHAVSIQNFTYSQTSLTVKKGDKVVFTNKDSVQHTVTADDDAFASAMLNTNATFTLDTSKLAPGTYSYHCTPHPSMKGTIVVQ